MKIHPVANRKNFPSITRCSPNIKSNPFSSILNEKIMAGRQPKVTTQTERPAEVQSPALSGKILLGTITRETPTISALLRKHPVYGKDLWNIVYADCNQDKPYTKILPGTNIYLNEETSELNWQADKANSKKPESAPVSGPEIFLQTNFDARDHTDADTPSINLAEAVKSYIGRPYHEINCYELLIRGLVKMGVRYQGSGGLMEKLRTMAKEKGLPANAFLNGEGIVAASGPPVYAKSISMVRDSEKESGQLFAELKPLLNEGYILSFSTPTRGHTGVVGRKDDSWTYINSGRMDNQIDKTTMSPKRVGEEVLAEEIENWFILAKRRHESLQVTVGRLEQQRLPRASTQTG